MAPLNRIGTLKEKFDPHNLRQRLMSALVLMPLALACAYAGGMIFNAGVAIVVLLSMHEWLRMVAPQCNPNIRVAVFAVLLVQLIAAISGNAEVGIVGGAVAAIGLYVMIRSRRGNSGEGAAWIVLGLPYLASGGIALIYLRDVPANGWGLICYVFAVVWATDIGAYATGRMIGGPKLWPKISPKKTWAGLLGGMVFAAGFGYAVAAGFEAARPALASGLAVVLAVVAQGGDLFESYVKRCNGVKDSGNLIPGHGGMLDRIDGLLFAVVGVALFEAGFGQSLRWWSL